MPSDVPATPITQTNPTTETGAEARKAARKAQAARWRWIGGPIGIAVATVRALVDAGWSPAAMAWAVPVLALAALAAALALRPGRGGFWLAFVPAALGALVFPIGAALHPRPSPEAMAQAVEQRLLERNPGLTLLAKREPATWAELHRALVAAVHDHPNESPIDLGNRAVTLLGPSYVLLAKGATRAGDEAVAEIYRTKVPLLTALRAASPEACKAFLDNDLRPIMALSPELRNQIKAADDPLGNAYVEGADRPERHIPTAAQADAALLRMQQATGILLSDEDTKYLFGDGPAAPVCDATLRLATILANSPAAQSAPVIRFLLLQ